MAISGHGRYADWTTHSPGPEQFWVRAVLIQATKNPPVISRRAEERIPTRFVSRCFPTKNASDRAYLAKKNRGRQVSFDGQGQIFTSLAGGLRADETQGSRQPAVTPGNGQVLDPVRNAYVPVGNP